MTSLTENDPFTSFGIGRRAGAPLADMVQALGPGVTDHRGLIDLPALTVLFDDIGGLSFFYSGTGSTVQARLTMSMMDRPTVDEVLDGASEVAMAQGPYGVSTVRITGDEGRLLCTGIARSVRVGREIVVDGDAAELPEPVAPAAAGALPTTDLQRTGREIVADIVDGTAPIGELGRLLGGTVSFDDDGEVRFDCVTAPWMGNVMGTMHGGVIAAVVAQGLSFAGQAAAPAGVEYQLVDFSVAFLRSPAVDGRTLQVRTKTTKVGRRLGIFTAELYDGDVLLATAHGDVRFDA